MKSIRRSLTLSFLALLAVVLAAVAVLTDSVTGRTLRAREKAASALIEARYDERRREAAQKLDEVLLAEARVLYSQMQSQYAARFDQEGRKFRTVLQVTEGLFGASPLGRPVWAGGAYRGPFFFQAARAYFDHLRLDDVLADPELDPDARAGGLYQVNIASRTGSVWRSASMGGGKFPTDPLAGDKVFDWAFDTPEVSGAEVRRVVFRGPLIAPWGGRFGGASRTGGSSRPPRDRDPAGPSPPERDPNGPPPLPPPPDRVIEAFPRIYVHCGRPVSGLAAGDAVFRDERDRQLAALSASVDRDRVRLRFWLAAIGGAAFLATVIGGPLLISRGLVPVRTLSDAVSRVNERDFRLPVEPVALSRELLPIHARLSATLDELRRAFEREKQSVADISHELRTPVAGLLATLDVTLRKPRTADQYRAALEDARGIGRQLAGLVERVMTLARLDAGSDRVAPADADAVLIAADCAALVRPLAVANGLAFTAELDGPAPLVTDPDKLKEVVVNLLHNAVEYNRPGGSIRLTVRAGGGGAVVEVADTGIGMAPDVRAHIFERFYRADPSRHAAGVHAGLGLSIVKEYVDRLGGAITVETEPGGGSTFRVTLPGPGSVATGHPPEPIGAVGGN